MPQTAISEMLAARIWRVLIDAGCIPPAAFGLPEFTDYITHEERGEFILQSTLGAGGKFHFHPTWGWRVSCAQKDETPVRKQVIEATNRRLKEMWSDFVD